MTWYIQPHRPTLRSTVAEIWAVSRAIWRDYRDCARQARRAARRRPGVIFTRASAWHNDPLILAIVALAWACAVITLAGEWGQVAALLSRIGGLQ